MTSPHNLRPVLQDGGEHYAGQIGDEPTLAEFVESLPRSPASACECSPSGSLWVNLGDKYSATSTPPAVRQVQDDRHRHKGVDDVLPRRISPARRPSPHRHPWRYHLRCIDDLGLILRAEVILSKPNGLPESVTDRVRRSTRRGSTSPVSRAFCGRRDPRRASFTPTTPDAHARYVGKVDAPAQYGNTDGRRRAGKLPGSVWTIPTQPLRVPEHLGIDHFAAFPMELRAHHPGLVTGRDLHRVRRRAEACRVVGRSRHEPTSGAQGAELATAQVSQRAPCALLGRNQRHRPHEGDAEPGKNTADVHALADHARSVLGGYSREYLLRRPTGFTYACACP